MLLSLVNVFKKRLFCSMNYFEDLISLLKEEKQYDFNQHQDLLLNKSLQERRLQGVSWFPISISSTELGRGDYLSITIQKTNYLEDGHKFRFGMPVALFSNYNPSEDRLDGIISYVSRDTMRIAVRVDELPDWCRRGKLGVDLLFDEHSYREMFDALDVAKSLFSNAKEGKLIRQLLGEESLTFDSIKEESYQNINLNNSQNEAIRAMLTDNPLTILHGPPGTGKTTTLVAGIQALVKDNRGKILVVAPSNTAVDLLSEKLALSGVSVVRIGNSVRVSEHLQELTLDARIDKHAANKERKVLEKQARAYTDMAHKYKRNFGKAERDQRKALFDEAKKIRREIDKIQDYIIEDVLQKVEVITATLVGANHYIIRNYNYHTVIIDEAAQALEPACWIPILKADRVILAGDHCQLPPTVKSSMKPNEGLYLTLFEKLIKRFPESVSLLDTQYRMHVDIMEYPSRILYDSRLQAADMVSNWTINEDIKPVVFIDTAGAGYDELIEDTAISNKEEALFLYRQLTMNVQNLEKNYNESNFPSIGIITPYRQQAILLKEIIHEDEKLKALKPNIQVHTIDSFQGQEKDIIYISLTRSNANQQIGFLADIRRMNVAMTRAKKKLIVIGDSATVGQHYFYKGFIDYVSELEAYHSVWEWGE